ncbi:MAG: thermonuclease family protein [Acidimicrobiia bacterium]|nr:thermonuclease family protein [Acidimicrobiia bacterium]
MIHRPPGWAVACALLLGACGRPPGPEQATPLSSEPAPAARSVTDEAPEDVALPLPGPGGKLMPQGYPATLQRVVDGDTVVIDIAGDEETVRLIGIDTPETHKPNTPVECFGPEATEALRELIPEGTALLVSRDTESRDVYGRLLAYVFRAEDGLFVNLEIAERGYADVLVIPPNTTFAAQFRAAVARASGQGLGLWGACPTASGSSS